MRMYSLSQHKNELEVRKFFELSNQNKFVQRYLFSFISISQIITIAAIVKP